MKFTEECVMFTEKLILLKIVVTNGLNIGLLQHNWVEKTVYRVETH